jgi:arylsulfatase A-like enzyme/tetratricopeptide (TPR) repeat protein
LTHPEALPPRIDNRSPSLYDPAAMAPLSRFALFALVCVACSPSERPPSAILITLDTTRADVLGCYGGPEGVTPHLDRIASESIVFDAARTVAPITLPSHASMLTGLYPPRHTLRDNARNGLPSAAYTLAEAARDAGYETAAFVSAVVLDRSYGLAQGFDVYRQPESDAGRGSFYVGELPSEETVSRVETWWKARDKDRPFFLWVHFFDPHAPYAPAKRFLDNAPHPYLGEVSAMDEGIGRLVDRFRDDGILDESLLVIVADHGEGLGDHGEPSHGVFCYDGTIRVPLIVRPPASVETVAGALRGERTDAVASVADVFPTVVDALGLEVAGAPVDGRSLLLPLDASRGVYFETYGSYLDFGWSPLFGWADSAGKYIHGPSPELFATSTDPREQRDLFTEGSESVASYREAIGRVTGSEALPIDEAPAASAALLEGIRDLGYTASGESLPELPGPFDELDAPSPTERGGELRDYADALTLLQVGKTDEALTILRRLIVSSPRNFYAHEALAKALFDTQGYAECVTVLDALLRLRPGQALHTSNLGLCHEHLGEPDLAEQAYRQALELAPEDPLPLGGLVRVLMNAGRADEARPFAARLREAKQGN